MVSVNDRIGMLLIIGPVDTRRVRVVCDCGITQNSLIKNLESGKVDRCRKCMHHKMDTNGTDDLTGKVYGKWTVLFKTRAERTGKLMWQCRCECGTEKAVYGGHLKQGNSKSCHACTVKSGTDHAQSTGAVGNIPNAWWTEHVMRQRKQKKRINMEISITIEYADKLFVEQGGKCKLTGLPIMITTGKHRDRNTASLDRINSAIGYIPGNVQWLHKDVNMLKNIYDQEYFIRLCALVSNHAVSLVNELPTAA